MSHGRITALFQTDLESYSETYTDDMLRNMWNITDEEWQYIDSKITTIVDGEK